MGQSLCKSKPILALTGHLRTETFSESRRSLYFLQAQGAGTFPRSDFSVISVILSISVIDNANAINRSANAWGGEKDWATVLKKDNGSYFLPPICPHKFYLHRALKLNYWQKQGFEERSSYKLPYFGNGVSGRPAILSYWLQI